MCSVHAVCNHRWLVCVCVLVRLLLRCIIGFVGVSWYNFLPCSYRYFLVLSQTLSSTGTKKGELFLADINTQLKHKNVTTDIKVDTAANVCFTFTLFTWNYAVLIFYLHYFFLPKSLKNSGDTCLFSKYPVKFSSELLNNITENGSSTPQHLKDFGIHASSLRLSLLMSQLLVWRQY